MRLTAGPGLGLLILALPGLLSGCADKCSGGETGRPPAVLLQQLPEPQFRGRTNADLLVWALELRQALRIANSDKRALQRWAEED